MSAGERRLFRVTYTDEFNHKGERVTARTADPADYLTWHTRAYSAEGAEDRFYAGEDSDGWIVVKVERVKTEARHA